MSRNSMNPLVKPWWNHLHMSVLAECIKSIWHQTSYCPHTCPLLCNSPKEWCHQVYFFKVRKLYSFRHLTHIEQSKPSWIANRGQATQVFASDLANTRTQHKQKRRQKRYGHKLDKYGQTPKLILQHWSLTDSSLNLNIFVQINLVNSWLSTSENGQPIQVQVTINEEQRPNSEWLVNFNKIYNAYLSIA